MHIHVQVHSVPFWCECVFSCSSLSLIAVKSLSETNKVSVCFILLQWLHPRGTYLSVQKAFSLAEVYHSEQPILCLDITFKLQIAIKVNHNNYTKKKKIFSHSRNKCIYSTMYMYCTFLVRKHLFSLKFSYYICLTLSLVFNELLQLGLQLSLLCIQSGQLNREFAGICPRTFQFLTQCLKFFTSPFSFCS